MFERADRYTVKHIDSTELAVHIQAADRLRLQWFVDGEYGHTKFYTFLDAAGKRNYLTRQYGNVVDEIRAIIETSAHDTDASDVLKLITERVGL